jgi:hypothetical protein
VEYGGVDFMKRSKEINRRLWTFLSDFDIICTTKEGKEKKKEKKLKDGSFEKTINVSGVYDFLKCHRYVSK